MTQEEIKYHNQLWYYKTYNQLIDKCIQMESEGYPEDMYTEVHHILPKCMGGTDSRKNLIKNASQVSYNGSPITILYLSK